MKNSKIIYSISEEDLQRVAIEEIGRRISKEEIEKIIPLFEEKINWYEAITNSINETVE